MAINILIWFNLTFLGNWVYQPWGLWLFLRNGSLKCQSCWGPKRPFHRARLLETAAESRWQIVRLNAIISTIVNKYNEEKLKRALEANSRKNETIVSWGCNNFKSLKAYLPLESAIVDCSQKPNHWWSCRMSI